VPAEHEVAKATALGLMAFATACGVLGIFLARYFYAQGPDKVRGIVAGIAPIHKLVVNKFYVDEIYDLIIIRPFRWVATFVYNVFDRFVIDLVFVNGAAFVTDVFGRLLRFVQNGDVQRYFAAIVFGVVGIVVWTTWWTEGSDIGFSWKGDASSMTFTADVGKGPTAKNAEVRWDFNTDGEPDSTAPEATWTFGKPGTYKVSMWVQEKVQGKVVKITRSVVVRGGSGPVTLNQPEPAGGGAP
jgi:surface-anchored protein